MTTVAVMMIKDEADVIAGTLRHMADEVDALLVADNGSIDGTREILDDLTYELPLTVVHDPVPAYFQSAKMSALAERAASELGAEWIIAADADELWVAPHRIRDVLAGLDCDLAWAELFNHFCSSIDPPGTDPFRTIVWRQREPATFRKVAFRWEPGSVIHQGNHGVTRPSGGEGVPALQIRHFPYRSAEQFKRKAINGARAYALTDLPESEGAHWRAYGAIADRYGPEALEKVFEEHFYYLSPIDHGLVLDPAPYLRWRS